jgi:hypothetical protein
LVLDVNITANRANKLSHVLDPERLLKPVYTRNPGPIEYTNGSLIVYQDYLRDISLLVTSAA